MKIFMVAGEASGDVYGGLIAKGFSDSGSTLQGWGGENMTSSGVMVTKHYRELAYMGVWEVIANLPAILQNIQSCWDEIQAFNPDALVLIDFPGFNMRIARKAHKAGIKVYQVVAPQVWAWKKSRVNYSAVFPVLPFEHDFLLRFGVRSIYHGHPILDTLVPTSTKAEHEIHAQKPILALLPGSRKQEIQKMLPLLLNVAKKFPSMAGAPGASKELYRLAEKTGINVVFGKTKDILGAAKLAVVTSGTATLEAAPLQAPHVLVYKTSWLTYLAAKTLVKVKYIGLTNLILGREAIPELIQDQCTAENIQRELSSKKVNAQLEGFQELRGLLGEQGASKKIADTILSFISNDQLIQGTKD